MAILVGGCSSCCSECNSNPNKSLSASSSDHPFSFSHLLPAGTVTINLPARRWCCGHCHAEDGWHDFIEAVAVEDGFSDHLAWLISHDFVRATCARLGTGALVIIRIYVVPYDLADIGGRLMQRKEDVLALSKEYMRYLLSQVVRDPVSWQGGHASPEAPMFLPPNSDNRSLAEIYGDLPSPDPSVTPALSVTERLLNYEDNLNGLGLRSTLHRYQRRSVAAMLGKEFDRHSPLPVPLYIPVSGIGTKRFYLQPGTLEMLAKCPLVDPCRGGILCEELGTGKTVICLALILATLTALSQPDPLDHTPILTPLSFRHFSTPDTDSVRSRFPQPTNAKTRSSSPSSGVPSLCEILLHLHSVRPTPSTMLSQPKEDYVLGLFHDLHKQNAPYHYSFPSLLTPNVKRSSRFAVDNSPRKVYLTTATLIVLPPALVRQWEREIGKHCEIEIRTLVIRKSDSIPKARELAVDYDIVLVTYEYFSSQASNFDPAPLHSWKKCQCPEYQPSIRVPICTCPSPTVSPLLQVRWKRLIIDEGHVSGSHGTKAMQILRRLGADARWVVTGTPTTNLLGLGLGKKEIEVSGEDGSNEDYDEGGLGDGEGVVAGSQSFAKDSEDSVRPRSRRWDKSRQDDILKLLRMIDFIGLPFLRDMSATRLDRTHIKDPLYNPGGPLPGAVAVLEQLMAFVMVRHRVIDVEMEVTLKPLKHEPVLLDLNPLALKSYNALQASLAVNAVTSNRVDKDYMFHRSNLEYWMTTQEVMSQLMLWHVDDGLYNVDEMLRTSEDNLKKMTEEGRSAADMQLLRDAYKHIRLAAEDELWRSIQYHEDIPFHVNGMPKPIFNAWTRVPLAQMMHADRLMRIRRIVTQHPLRSKEEYLINLGREVSETDRVIREQHIAQLERKVKGTRQEDIRKKNVARKAADPQAWKEVQMDLKRSLERLEKLEAGFDQGVNYSVPGSDEQPSELLRQSVLRDVRIGSSGSTKLDFILEEVLKYSATEKFLIFSDSELTLAYIAEALDLIQVKYLRLTTAVQPQMREAFVLTFETSQTYRVFLMDLKYGARGLNLISASRIIFCEPVWQADVESQAIKRAHRIGQTKEIRVKTLAIRGTHEEHMVIRRNALKHNQGKLPNLIEEAGMRHFIENPKFIEYESRPEPRSLDIPLINVPPAEDPQDVAMTVVDVSENLDVLRTDHHSSQQTAQRTVSFQLGPRANSLQPPTPPRTKIYPEGPLITPPKRFSNGSMISSPGLSSPMDKISIDGEQVLRKKRKVAV